MVKKESLMRNNIKRFKSKEKRFDHFGDYLVMYATLFGLFANLCKDYIPVGSKKTKYTIVIAMILEIMYIMAISLKITSHYSVKKYISDYKCEEKIQENYVRKQVELDIEVPSKHLKVPHSSDFNAIINHSLAAKKLKSTIKCAIWVLASAFLFSTVSQIKFPSLITLIIIVVYMGLAFPILLSLFANNLFQHFLFLDEYAKKNRFTMFIEKIINHINH